MIKIDGERKVLGIIVGLIFIIVVILAVLISVNERTKTSVGKTRYGGNEGIIGVVLPDHQGGTTPTAPTVQKRDTVVPAKRETVTRTPVIETVESAEKTSPQIVVVSPFQIAENFQRARSIILNSQCYELIGDVREITYYTPLVGQKFIADLQPGADFTTFTAIIVVKLTDSRHIPVFYQEYPITVDINARHVTECKGKPITMADILPPVIY